MMRLFQQVRFFVAASVAMVVVLLAPNAAAEKFRSAVFVPTPTAPNRLISADFNDDGLSDFVYTGLGGSVNVLLATGPQSYGAVTTLSVPSGDGFSGMTVADVNGDGRKDLIACGNNGAQGIVAVFLGAGNGTFQPAIVSIVVSDPSAFPGLTSIAYGDFDQDGKLDLAIGDESGVFNSSSLYIVRGDGLGHFVPMYQAPDPNGIIDVKVADFNKDGHLDLVVKRFPGNDLIVYTGDGTGNFTPTAYDNIFLQPGNPSLPDPITSVAISDMDGDGFPDLVVGASLNGLEIMLNDGTGHFAAAPAGTGASLPPNFDSILTVADLNHDGKLDLAGCSTNGLHIFFGNGDLTFQPGTTYALPASALTTTWADFNGDGVIDFASPVEKGIAIAYGNPDGTFRAARSYDVVSQVEIAAIADVNGDGIPDIVAGADSGPVAILGRGDGTFTVVPSALTSSNLTPFPMAVADFNGDGKPDVVLWSALAPSVQLFLGTGDGTFQPSTDYVVASQIPLTPMIAGDFNGDAKPDLAFGASVTLNTAAGTFPANVPISNGVNGMVTADLNKDGKLDLAFIDVTNSTLQVVLGNGNGTLQSPTTYTLSEPPNDLTVVDIDGDGNLDLVVTSGQVPNFLMLAGKGDGTFDAPVVVSTPGFSGVLVNNGLIKGDSHPDLAMSDGSLLGVLNNNGDGTFQPPLIYVAGFGPGKPLLADMNGDGTPDMVVPDVDVNLSTTVTVLLNCGGTHSTLADSLAPQSQYGQPVVFTVTLSPVGAGCGVPTGSVTLTDNGTPLQTGTLNTGQLAITISSLSVGSHVIAATYTGDSVFNSSTVSSLTHIVVKAASSVTVGATPNPALVGQTVTLSAAVTPAFTGTPTGIVTFFNGTTTLGQANLDASGAATLTLSNLATASYSITAVYAGDGNFNAGTSTALAVFVTDFSLSAANTSQTITAGHSASYPLSLVPTIGFAATVKLSCSGVPSGASCTITPSSATLSGSPVPVPATATATVSTTAPSARLRHPRAGPLFAVLSFGFGGIVLLLIPVRRSRGGQSLGMVLLFASLAALPSCGGGGGGGGGSGNGTPPGASTIVVTGTTTAGGVTLTHSVSLSLTVQ